MANFTGTNGNDLFDQNGIAPGNLIDGLGGQDTIDGLSNNGSYLYDFENNVLSLSNGSNLATLLNFEEVLAGNGDDILIGGNAAATNNLNGGNGDDTVSPGSAGIITGDVYAGGAGLDVLDFSNLTGDHVVDTNTGEFTSGGQIAMISGFEEIFAGSGDDFIREESFIDSTLHGGLGNDTLAAANTGFSVGEVFDGGAGTDMFDYSNQSNEYQADLMTGLFENPIGTDIATLTSIEQISAGSGNDTLTAGNVASAVYSLFGNDGDDSITARPGALVNGDTYDGGAGSDTFDFSSFTGNFRLNTNTGDFRTSDGSIVGTAANFERIFAGSGNDVIGGNSSDQNISGGAGNDTITGGDGADTLMGGSDQDILRADNGDDVIVGGGGNDFGSGGDGMDQLFGDAGDDTMVGGDGNDTIDGGEDNDGLAGNNGNDSIIGGLGADRLFGEAGFDTLIGGVGGDRLEGGDQADNLFGESGVDTMLGGAGFDRLFGGDDNDLGYGGTEDDALFGESGNDRLYGQDGNDRLFGGIGNDLLDGGAGNDNLQGNAGFDTLVGGLGNDMLSGNFNADIFVFADVGGGFGQDTITDFDATNDFEKIDLSRVASIVNLYDLLSNHASQLGADVLIDAGGGNTITLTNTNLADLDAADFIF